MSNLPEYGLWRNGVKPLTIIADISAVMACPRRRSLLSLLSFLFDLFVTYWQETERVTCVEFPAGTPLKLDATEEKALDSRAGTDA
jgi:hypothetical protein